MSEILRVAGPIDEYAGIEIFYLDNHLLILRKPPNLPAQADASGDSDVLTLMKQYIGQRYQKPGAVYLGLVHRLDRPVGGLMVLARTSKAAARLSAQVRDKALHRVYLAVARGEAPVQADLRDFLLKNPADNTTRVVPQDTPGAKEALLSLRTLARREGQSLVMIRLQTGRSHQIRVQTAQAGVPLWGDARYGGGRPGQPIALYAAALGLRHTTRDLLVQAVSSPPWDDLPWAAFSPEQKDVESALEEWI